jgi:hypothetical protein
MRTPVVYNAVSLFSIRRQCDLQDFHAFHDQIEREHVSENLKHSDHRSFLVTSRTSYDRRASKYRAFELKRVFNEGGDGELIAAIKERRWRELRRLVPLERALCAIAGS